MRMLLKRFLLVCVLVLGACSAAQAAPVIGTSTTYSGSSINAVGTAQAYRFRASTSGSIDTIHVYLAPDSTASKVEIAVYSGSWKSAGTRRQRCVITSPQAGAWNACTPSSAYSVVSGSYYWLAVLQPTGTSGQLVYGEGQIAGDPTTYFSKSATLPSMPSVWSNGPGFTGGYQGSIYADAATVVPPPPPSPSPPTAAFTVSPASPVTGQLVTLDGSGSTCSATPCFYNYIDTTDSSSLGNQQVSQYTFQTAGTKLVQLMVTDAQNRTAIVEHDVVVTASSGGGGCDLNATPSNFSTQVAAATTGQIICLASGSYGTWTGTNKAITIKAASGATPTMTDNFGSTATGFTLDGISGMSGNINGSHSITIQNSTFASEQDIQGGATGIVFNNDHFPAFVGMARIWSGVGANTVTIEHSTFDNPTGLSGGADGVRCDDGTTTVLDNDFSGIKDADTGNHGDPIQIYGGQCIIKGNYFHGMLNSATCSLGEWDGGSNNIFENNVVNTGHCYEAMAILGDHNSLIDHNTFITPTDGTCFANPQTECASVESGYKTSEGGGSSGDVYRNNVFAGIDNGGGGGTATYSEDHNLCSTGNGCGNTGDITGAPTLTGGSQPTTWDGFHLAAGSLGKGAASDGLDMGILPSPS